MGRPLQWSGCRWPRMSRSPGRIAPRSRGYSADRRSPPSMSTFPLGSNVAVWSPLPRPCCPSAQRPLASTVVPVVPAAALLPPPPVAIMWRRPYPQRRGWSRSVDRSLHTNMPAADPKTRYAAWLPCSHCGPVRDSPQTVPGTSSGAALPRMPGGLRAERDHVGRLRHGEIVAPCLHDLAAFVHQQSLVVGGAHLVGSTWASCFSIASGRWPFSLAQVLKVVRQQCGLAPLAMFGSRMT